MKYKIYMFDGVGEKSKTLVASGKDVNEVSGRPAKLTDAYHRKMISAPYSVDAVDEEGAAVWTIDHEVKWENTPHNESIKHEEINLTGNGERTRCKDVQAAIEYIQTFSR